MLKRLLFIFFGFNLFISTAFSADYRYNYEFNTPISCANYNGTDQPPCYPFIYEDSAGSNTFCNWVAAINYFGPIITLATIKLANYCTGKQEKETRQYIKAELDRIFKSETEIVALVSRIVKSFPNGIGQMRGDDALIQGTIIALNKHKCKKCVETFIGLIKEEVGPETSQSDESFAENFRDFADRVTTAKEHQICLDHNYEAVENCSYQKQDVNKIKETCCYNWTNPWHWSSMCYSAITLAVSGAMPLLLDIHSRAGSYFGDMANVSNAIVIPSVGLYNLWQISNSMRQDKSQRLLEKIDERLANTINGSIEMAAQAIGHMRNSIDYQHARAIFTALVLAGWPEQHVNEFEQLASNNQSTSDEVDDLTNRLRAHLRAYLKNLYPANGLADKIVRQIFASVDSTESDASSESASKDNDSDAMTDIVVDDSSSSSSEVRTKL